MRKRHTGSGCGKRRKCCEAIWSDEAGGFLMHAADTSDLVAPLLVTDGCSSASGRAYSCWNTAPHRTAAISS